MGQIYRDLGILATEEVLEKSASDLVGQYVGHTGKKTKELLESALGKVLLIDEAYRLAKGDFANEAADELVDLLTKPQFAQKLIVILAGYDHEIEHLLGTNRGLTSRFSREDTFPEFVARSLHHALDLAVGKGGVPRCHLYPISPNIENRNRGIRETYPCGELGECERCSELGQRHQQRNAASR